MTLATIKRTTTNYTFRIPYFDTPAWGTAVERNFDIIDAVMFAFTGLGNIVGEWANATGYTVGQRAVDSTDNTLWQCAVAHTSASSGTFAADRASNPTYWDAVTTQAANRGQWTTATNYNTNEFVYDAGRFGVVTQQYTSGATYAADVANGDIVTVLDLSAYEIPDPAVADSMIVRNSGNTTYEAKTFAQVVSLLGVLSLGGGTMTGSIDLDGNDLDNPGTVDGRDVAVDGAKLDNVEDNADVTDAANVAAAGALMQSGGTMSGDIDMGGNDILNSGNPLGGPSAGTNSIIRQNAVNIAENITLYDHATTFTADAGADTLDVGTDDRFLDGDVVYLTTTGTLPAGLSVDTAYYVRDITAGTMKLAATYDGSAIDITDAGIGTHTIHQAINGSTVGPVTIEDGFTVTVPEGSTWVIL